MSETQITEQPAVQEGNNFPVPQVNYDLVEHENIKKAYDLLKIEEITDKDQFKEVNDLRLRSRRLRLDITKHEKKLIDPAKDYIKTVKEQGKAIVEDIETVEKPLLELEGVWKEKENARKAEALRIREELIQSRTEELMSLGMKFNGFKFTITGIVIQFAELGDMDEETYSGYIIQLENLPRNQKKEETTPEITTTPITPESEASDNQGLSPEPNSTPVSNGDPSPPSVKKEVSGSSPNVSKRLVSNELNKIELLIEKLKGTIGLYKVEGIAEEFDKHTALYIAGLNEMLVANGRDEK